jgi:GTP-binding protein HflX
MIITTPDDASLDLTAVLIGVCDQDADVNATNEHLAELEELANNIALRTVERIVVKRRSPGSQYYIGSGKANEIAEKIKDAGISCIIFDNDLTPSQQRNWEKLTKIQVIDRQEVILDIFAKRALTREATIQVKLARMRYLLPRLTGAWSHLSRQRGGNSAARGEGEKQIEVDRRIVKLQIATLSDELKILQQQRETQRKGRSRNAIPQTAIVGYTNAGKSSLLNKLAKAGVLVEDKLFATLDPTTRKIILPNKLPVLLTDTVGFIRKLPHSLIEAFKSTLEEAVVADLLIILLDISNPSVEDHWETTMTVLKELGADEKNMLVVFNKMDMIDDTVLLARIRGLFPDACYISTLTGAGLDELLERLGSALSQDIKLKRFLLPPSRHDLVAFIHKHGQIFESEYDEIGNLQLLVNIKATLLPRLMDYIVLE